MTLALTFVLAYLLGSIPFGLIIARALGLGDLRAIGSGNIGATNVLRTGNKAAAAATLLLDAAKGAAAVLVARALAGESEELVAALGAIHGNLLPVLLRFSGGKGVATALGVFLLVDPLACGASVLLFALVYAVFRIASLGSLLAALAFPFALWWRGHPPSYVWLAVALALLIVVRHRDNIRRLRAGREAPLEPPRD
jgi:glycerol-3-phosphate acyltransferase PlsY